MPPWCPRHFMFLSIHARISVQYRLHWQLKMLPGCGCNVSWLCQYNRLDSYITYWRSLNLLLLTKRIQPPRSLGFNPMSLTLFLCLHFEFFFLFLSHPCGESHIFSVFFRIDDTKTLQCCTWFSPVVSVVDAPSAGGRAVACARLTKTAVGAIDLSKRT